MSMFHYATATWEYKKVVHAIHRDILAVNLENSGKKSIFLILLLKTLVVGYMLDRVLTSTSSLCFGPKIRKKYVYPCKPHFFLYKSGV